jgi:beta-lactamase superfamily II metal-dependent hydrolase
MTKFLRNYKKDFDEIYSKVEEEKKINSSKDFKNVFTKILAKMNALWSSVMVRVLKKFEKTNSDLINFSIKFDFRLFRKGEFNFALSGKAEATVDDENVKIKDFIV